MTPKYSVGVYAFLSFIVALTSSLSVHAATVDYTALGSFTTPALNTGGILVTGSANVNIAPGFGVGIVGGVLDGWIDGSEFVDFTFAAPAVNVSYQLLPIGDIDTDGIFGERIVEAFAVGGSSLGAFSQSGFATQVSSLFGNVPIERFRLTPDGDGFGLASVTFDTAPTPLPAALPLFATGLGALGLLGWRRKRKAAASAA
jgi:hypothetical protein